MKRGRGWKWGGDGKGEGMERGMGTQVGVFHTGFRAGPFMLKRGSPMVCFNNKEAHSVVTSW